MIAMSIPAFIHKYLVTLDDISPQMHVMNYHTMQIVKYHQVTITRIREDQEQAHIRCVVPRLNNEPTLEGMLHSLARLINEDVPELHLLNIDQPPADHIERTIEAFRLTPSLFEDFLEDAYDIITLSERAHPTLRDALILNDIDVETSGFDTWRDRYKVEHIMLPVTSQSNIASFAEKANAAWWLEHHGEDVRIKDVEREFFGLELDEEFNDDRAVDYAKVLLGMDEYPLIDDTTYSDVLAQAKAEVWEQYDRKLMKNVFIDMYNDFHNDKLEDLEDDEFDDIFKSLLESKEITIEETENSFDYFGVDSAAREWATKAKEIE